ncbi:hypothetical protein ABEP17_18305 [Priestia flexa]|uniref:hypothetical protein n=1 Tax=Priestia flexa TaxID=86664 RepID=UPI003D2B53D3
MTYPYRRSGVKRIIEGTNIEQELIYVKDGSPFWDTIHEPTDAEISFIHAILKLGIDYGDSKGDITVKDGVVYERR